MNVTRMNLIKLFNELSYKRPDRWSKARMLGKVKELPNISDIEEKLEGELNKKLLKQLLEAVKTDEDIFITDKKEGGKKGKEAGSKKKAAKKKATKKNATKKNATKKKATPSEPAKRKSTDKSRIYSLWFKASKQDASTAEGLIKKIKAKVKLTTVKSWISGWKNDRGIPAVVD